MTIRRYKPRSIGATVEKLTQPIFGRRGFGRGVIIADWPNIAGSILAKHTFPEKIIYPRNQRGNGTLHLRIDSPALALELQHLEPQLLEKINTHFGYKAVSYINIIQGTLPNNNNSPVTKKKTITPEQKNALANCLHLIEDPDLKKALQALGTEIKSMG
jgi:hypothetical protein